ncbi:hypothetical protein A4X06_0g1248 [Tilletia controversa]|uniref:Uncharacterized protein n=1 Tax=Tilletia controversa TaxID=13291 RepID=A0A8X7MZW9_9BASI|nr:hypothetical protein CF336_g168 [Tilletia laevis]KAE8203677.1 hypothetical protein CF328_g1523 [Tilletia controversa]KAE8253732.1 hypothetical protein A4X06_0g1248 [Tilletia controversa]
MRDASSRLSIFHIKRELCPPRSDDISPPTPAPRHIIFHFHFLAAAEQPAPRPFPSTFRLYYFGPYINGDAAAPSPAQQAVSAIVVGLEADLDQERTKRQGVNRAYTELEKELDAKDQDLFDARAEGASERMRADALAIAKDLSDKLLEEAQATIKNLNNDVAEANKKADGAMDKADGAIKKAAALGSENIKLNDKLKIANRTISQAAKDSKALAKVLADQLSDGKP